MTSATKYKTLSTLPDVTVCIAHVYIHKLDFSVAYTVFAKAKTET